MKKYLLNEDQVNTLISDGCPEEMMTGCHEGLDCFDCKKIWVERFEVKNEKKPKKTIKQGGEK